MQRIYAIAEPSSYGTPGLASIGEAIQDIYHHSNYPFVKRFSLGHTVLFFDTIEEAQHCLLPPENVNKWGVISISSVKYALKRGILELETEGTNVTRILRIHEIMPFQHPVWTSNALATEHSTPAALSALSNMLAERYVKPHNIDKHATHQRAQLCRQLSTHFKREHIRPGEADGLDFLRIIGGELLIAISLACLVNEDSRPAASVLLVMSIAIFAKIINHANRFNHYEDSKQAYIREHLFRQTHEAEPVQANDNNVRLNASN